MAQKLFWYLAAMLYTAAISLFFLTPGPLGSVILNYGFWILLGLAALAATVGNFVQAYTGEKTDLPMQDGAGQHPAG